MGGAFSIDSVSGVISVVGPLKWETGNLYNLTVTAFDLGDPVLSTNVTVTAIILRNDHQPHFTASLYVGTVGELYAPGSVITTVAAFNQQGTAMNYPIVAGNINDVFAMNLYTGEVSVSGIYQLNSSSISEYSLTVVGIDATLERSRLRLRR